MQRHGYDQATPKSDPSVAELPWLDFSSGYVQRAKDVLPKQGVVKPWRLYQNYALDMLTLRMGRIEDGTLKFAKKPAAANTNRPEAIAAE
jgi:hypothetical protein